jgi:hypothetical protein
MIVFIAFIAFIAGSYTDWQFAMFGVQKTHSEERIGYTVSAVLTVSHGHSGSDRSGMAYFMNGASFGRIPEDLSRTIG